jgi:hypothetical protein
MAGYSATSQTPLYIATGPVNLTTQSALSYIVGDQVVLVYAQNDSITMSGNVLSYNPITGAMVVNITSVSGYYGLQPVFNTEPWGSTSAIFSPWNLALIGLPTATQNATTPTILVRAATGPNFEPQRGQGLQNFLVDIDAVAQIIQQRILLLQGENFQNLSDGTPLFQSILGQSTTMQAVALIIRQRILGTPYVTGISSWNATYSAYGRAFTFSAQVNTVFGTITVTNQT